MFLATGMGIACGDTMPDAEEREVKGVKPQINEAREFIEIAKDFKRPQEILREALSNSWDANAKSVSVEIEAVKLPRVGSGRRKQRVNVTIQDDGDGMNEAEIHYFFNLGDSHKPPGSIGTKGHGTKIYYKSAGIEVVTYHGDSAIHARTDVPPWETLQKGIVPTYTYKVGPNSPRQRGTTIHVNEFDAPHSEFEDFNTVAGYLQWHSICGSLASALGSQTREMAVSMRLPGGAPAFTLKNRFNIPPEKSDLSKGTSDTCKHSSKVLGIDCGETSGGEKVRVDFFALLLGDSARGFIPDTYNQTGLWLCKDHIMVERYNSVINDVTGGEYYYRSFLAFANCQQFDLTANRNEVREDEAFELAIDGIKKAFGTVFNDDFTKTFFAAKSKEEESSKKARAIAEMEKRVDSYKKRPSLAGKIKVPGILAKVPNNEAETVLVLQAMISAGVRGIDFTLGEYSAYKGTDAIVEYEDKGIHQTGWLEAVRNLANLFDWDHNLERIHKVVCWDVGDVEERYKLDDGTVVKYEKAGKKHFLVRDGDAIPVYVLSEILGVSDEE